MWKSDRVPEGRSGSRSEGTRGGQAAGVRAAGVRTAEVRTAGVRTAMGWAAKVWVPTALVAGLVGGGCFEISPLAPCDFNEQCQVGEFCNRETGACEPSNVGGFGGGGAGGGGAGGVGGTGNTVVPFDMDVVVEKPNLVYVAVQGGSFSIGQPLDEEAPTDRSPERVVTLNSFAMTVEEITVAQYRQCVQDEVCRVPRRSAGCNYDNPGFDDHPVNCVSWFDARNFADWMEARLPNEVEWEYAARSLGQPQRVWPWGDMEGTCTDAVWSGLGNVCGQRTTMAGCSRTPGNTEQNICDLAGNVREWVQDDYVADYTNLPTDGGAQVANSGLKVLRGGSFGSAMPTLSTMARESASPDAADEFTGFRLVRQEP